MKSERGVKVLLLIMVINSISWKTFLRNVLLSLHKFVSVAFEDSGISIKNV